MPSVLDVGTGGQRYRLGVSLNGLPAQAIIDTGADVTVVATHIAARMPMVSWTRQASLQNFTGGVTIAQGPETLKVNAGSGHVTLDVYAAPILEDCILGNDALTSLGVVIDCGKRRVTLASAVSKRARVRARPGTRRRTHNTGSKRV